VSALAERLWQAVEARPKLALGLILAAQTVFALDSRSLWFSDEVRYANAYENVIRAGKWLVLSLNGQPYPDKPPVYFWLLALLDALTPLSQPAVFSLGVALSGFAFLLATLGLARALGLARPVGPAAGLVLLANLFFAGMLHYSRMDMLFAALIVACQACLYRCLASPSPSRWTVLGLALAGAAVLTKGPLGLALPLVACIAYLAWRGELARLARRDVLFGLACFLGLVAAWLLAALAKEGDTFIRNIFYKQIFQRAVATYHHAEPPSYYFVALPLAWLPWTLLALSLPVRRLLSRAFWSGLWAGRRAAGAQAFLALSAGSGFVLLTCLSGKVLIYILPLFAPLALLTAGRLLDPDAANLPRLWTAAAVLFLLLAAAGPFAPQIAGLAFPVRGLWLSSAILAATGVALLTLRGRPARQPLLALVLGVTLWMQPAALAVAPSLDPLMSPRGQAEIIRDYARQGFAPVAFDIYSGIYTYYAGREIPEINDRAELTAFLANHPKAVLAIRKKHWEPWPERPAGLGLKDERRIVDQVYVLAVQGE